MAKDAKNANCDSLLTCSMYFLNCLLLFLTAMSDVKSANISGFWFNNAYAKTFYIKNI